MSTSATVRAAFTRTVLGCLNSRLARARSRSAAISPATVGEAAAGARTTTTAGIALPGNALWIRL